MQVEFIRIPVGVELVNPKAPTIPWTQFDLIQDRAPWAVMQVMTPAGCWAFDSIEAFDLWEKQKPAEPAESAEPAE